MDFLYILIAAWALYSVYKNVINGFYMYIVYLAIAYFVVRFMVTGPKWRLFLAVIFANLLSVAMIVGNMLSAIQKMNVPAPITALAM